MSLDSSFHIQMKNSHVKATFSVCCVVWWCIFFFSYPHVKYNLQIDYTYVKNHQSVLHFSVSPSEPNIKGSFKITIVCQNSDIIHRGINQRRQRDTFLEQQSTQYTRMQSMHVVLHKVLVVAIVFLCVWFVLETVVNTELSLGLLIIWSTNSYFPYPFTQHLGITIYFIT